MNRGTQLRRLRGNRSFGSLTRPASASSDAAPSSRPRSSRRRVFLTSYGRFFVIVLTSTPQAFSSVSTLANTRVDG
jgi:hypothetical protein